VSSRVIKIVAVAMLGCLVGCSDTLTAPSNSAPFSLLDLRLGTGAEAAAGNTVTLNYTGWLYDPTQPDGKGIVFDTSVGGTPLTFQLGAGQVIQGFDRGVTGMKAGGARRVIIPSSLGYGPARNNAIPPYATLVFEIDLIDIVVPST
jgi:FKBP-type peptidyl-prolyl cis-trans isomerase FkpA